MVILLTALVLIAGLVAIGFAVYHAVDSVRQAKIYREPFFYVFTVLFGIFAIGLLFAMFGLIGSTIALL